MKKNQDFWQNFKKPIYALAPMAGITDSAFRLMCKFYGADVVYSEMASAAALKYAPEKTLELVRFEKKEKPYVVQLFGSKPEHFEIAVKIISKEIKPDGIDINFGCPVKKVQKQGAGAILMTDLDLSYRVIAGVIDNTELPVSVKIRAKAGDVDCLKFLDKMKDLKISAVMIHGRTLSQGHSGTVDWQIIKEARNHFGGVLLANGGAVDRQSAEELMLHTGADGLGIARGALGRPWIFEDLRSIKRAPARSAPTGSILVGTGLAPVRSLEEIFKIALKHAELAEKFKGKTGIIEMRKHLCAYVTGVEGASELRKEFVKVESLKEVEEIFCKY